MEKKYKLPFTNNNKTENKYPIPSHLNCSMFIFILLLPWLHWCPYFYSIWIKHFCMEHGTGSFIYIFLLFFFFYFIRHHVHIRYFALILLSVFLCLLNIVTSLFKKKKKRFNFNLFQSNHKVFVHFSFSNPESTWAYYIWTASEVHICDMCIEYTDKSYTLQIAIIVSFTLCK